MNREDIIRMAREAGLTVKPPFWGYTEHYHFAGFEQPFEHFVALVAAAEREACAKVCEGLGVHPALNIFNGGPEWYKHGKDCAAAIRARGQL